MPAAAGQIITHAGSLTTLAIIGLLPGSTDILAGMSLGGRVQGMLMFPLAAVNMSVVILSGHLLGSGAGDGLYQLRTQNRAAYGASAPSPPALLLYLLREPAASCFSADPPVLQQASTFLVFACLSLPFTAMTGMMNAFFPEPAPHHSVMQDRRRDMLGRGHTALPDARTGDSFRRSRRVCGRNNGTNCRLSLYAPHLPRKKMA